MRRVSFNGRANSSGTHSRLCNARDDGLGQLVVVDAVVHHVLLLRGGAVGRFGGCFLWHGGEAKGQG